MKIITLLYPDDDSTAEGHKVAIIPPDWDAYIEMLDKTEGMWADIGEELENTINEARQIWDEAWQKRLNSL